ncbi:hypothetical protein [Methanospirillum hungatei]|uniref:hypothetical protein n=1 Tax=Methanospirillum hungatei TaxID=2203 RepID=UPI00005DC9B4|nr:hypothetical protein [Methanospirillum hungatei]
MILIIGATPSVILINSLVMADVQVDLGTGSQKILSKSCANSDKTTAYQSYLLLNNSQSLTKKSTEEQLFGSISQDILSVSPNVEKTSTGDLVRFNPSNELNTIKCDKKQ